MTSLNKKKHDGDPVVFLFVQFKIQYFEKYYLHFGAFTEDQSMFSIAMAMALVIKSSSIDGSFSCCEE